MIFAFAGRVRISREVARFKALSAEVLVLNNSKLLCVTAIVFAALTVLIILVLAVLILLILVLIITVIITAYCYRALSSAKVFLKLTHLGLELSLGLASTGTLCG